MAPLASGSLRASLAERHRLVKLIDAWLGVRVGEQAEIQGLDLSQYGERGYNL